MNNVNLLWTLYPNIPDSNKWNLIRSQRNLLLAASDWTQLADAYLTETEKIAWNEYRQALRNLPQDFSMPEEVIFLEAPKRSYGRGRL